MRRIYTLLLVVLFLPICGGDYNIIDSRDSGENGAFSFCTEGKTWNYILFNVENEDSPEEPYSYVVKGDTIIGDFTYKKFYLQKDGTEQLAFMMREDGSKVFKIHPNDEERLFFDFGREDVGLVHHWYSEDEECVVNWMIYAIDAVHVNNVVFRRYCCYQEYSEVELNTIEDGMYVQKDYWVEGVGSARYGIESDGLEVLIRNPGITEYFISCYENGKCIFTAEDFTKPAYTTDMPMLRSNIHQEEQLYDLQGRRLSAIPPKGIYIQHGKKIMLK